MLSHPDNHLTNLNHAHETSQRSLLLQQSSSVLSPPLTSTRAPAPPAILPTLSQSLKRDKKREKKVSPARLAEQLNCSAFPGYEVVNRNGDTVNDSEAYYRHSRNKKLNIAASHVSATEVSASV